MANITVDTTRLNYLIESRQDLKGNTSYIVRCSCGSLRFRSLESVLDFLEMNRDLGYINV